MQWSVYSEFFRAGHGGAAVRDLWKVVKPGGMLAITTWGPHFFEPGNTAFWNAVLDASPDLYKSFNPWDRISDPQSVTRLLRVAGIEYSELIAEAGRHPVPSPGTWWSAVLGSGYRGTLERLDDQGRHQVRAANLAFIRTQVSAGSRRTSSMQARRSQMPDLVSRRIHGSSWLSAR